MKRLDRFVVLVTVGWLAGGCASVPTPEQVRWNLVEVGGKAVATAEQGDPGHILFDPGPPPRASGSTGCNRFVGSYTMSDSSLHFGSIATTRMACPGRMEQERAFELALEASRHWRIADGQLELLDEQGDILARFQPASN
jgi:heat shock protein HslJ